MDKASRGAYIIENALQHPTPPLLETEHLVSMKKFMLMVCTSLSAALVIVSTTSCERQPAHQPPPSSDSEQPTGKDNPGDEPAEAKASARVEAPEGWTVVDPEQLDEADRQRLERARAGQKALGGALIKELTTAISESSHEQAVTVCNERAPQIAAAVSADSDLAIGRTSFKLRNPENTPPEWAEPFVEARVDAQTVLRGEDKLAYLAPIQLGQMCASCHGTDDALAEGVEERIAELYPDDQATGFEPGELRGWFWVEVPES
jgi:hypothetical protein